MKKPKVSFVIPTLNEEDYIGECLNAIFRQDYPKNKIEVILVDNYSDDKTLEIARKFPVKILMNVVKHAEASKMVGFRKATGDLALYLDADMILRGRKWLSKMTKPFEDEDIDAAFTRFVSGKNAPPIERYYSFDPLQRDTIYKFFSPSIGQKIVGRTADYFICDYSKEPLPPSGPFVFRREKLMNLVKQRDMFWELDFLVIYARAGYDKFAYLPNVGTHHYHVTSLRELIKKRLYNLNKVYLPRQKRYYKWFDIINPLDIMKILVWIVYANLIIPSVFVGIYKSIKYRDWAGMYEPAVNLLVTDALVLSFLSRPGNFKKLINKKE